MNTFLIVGKNFSSLKSKILDQGDEYILLQDRETTRFPNKQLKRRILVDFSSKQSIVHTAEQFRGRIQGVICIYESYILATSWIAETLNVPGLSPEAAEACTDKYLMRQAFVHADEKISPDFAKIKSQQDLLNFADSHSYPLILKPANLAKSLLITKSSNRRELILNYLAAMGQIKQVYKKYAPNRTPKLLVEEFMAGSVHSVDAFVDHSGNPNLLKNIVDYQTGYDIGFDDNFHYSRLLPNKLTTKQQGQLLHCAELGIRSLGMKNSAAHVEIIMTAAGPRIVEIGARNGGYRERMHWLANGIDVLGNALRIALGQEPHITQTKNEPCAVLELFPRNDGTFKEIAHTTAIKSLSSFVSMNIKAQPGEKIGKAANGFKAAAIIILHNTNPAAFKRDLAFVDNQVRVETS